MIPTPRSLRALALPTSLAAAVAFAAAVSCARPPAATFEVVQPPPPQIESITHGAPGGARAGETVSITMKGDSDLSASASFGDLAPRIALTEDPAEKGLYRGSLTVPPGKSGTFALTGRLEASPERFATAEGPSLNVLAPVAQKVEEPARATAAELNARGVVRAIYFDFDKADLRADAIATLQANLDWLKANAGYRLLIEGHCDERGTNEYNMALGDRRANAARAWLVDAGLDSSRIRTVSYGEERPAEPGHDESAWEKNRRSAFVLED